MQVTFLGQGLQNGRSAGDVLIETFSNPHFNRFTAFVAFAGTAGIAVLQEPIIEAKSHITEWSVFVGVDQRGTSKEALEALLTLDIGTSVYYTKSPVTYHPKIYLFEGEEESLVLIGSSNLTERGLFSNVEASSLINIEGEDEEGATLIQQIKDYYTSFLQQTNANTQTLSQALITQLKDAKVIPTERERRKIHDDMRQENRLATPQALRAIEQLFPSVSVQRPARTEEEI